MWQAHHSHGAPTQCQSATSTNGPHTSRVCVGPLAEVAHLVMVRPPYRRFSPRVEVSMACPCFKLSLESTQVTIDNVPRAQPYYFVLFFFFFQFCFVEK